MAIFCFTITGCSYIEPETTIVKATVTNKEHIESQVKYGYYFDVLKGNFRWKYKLFPEEYNITIQYNELVKIYDSKSLYNAVEIGDTIDMELTTYFNSDGKIERQSISRINQFLKSNATSVTLLFSFFYFLYYFYIVFYLRKSVSFILIYF